MPEIHRTPLGPARAGLALAALHAELAAIVPAVGGLSVTRDGDLVAVGAAPIAPADVARLAAAVAAHVPPPPPPTRAELVAAAKAKAAAATTILGLRAAVLELADLLD